MESVARERLNKSGENSSIISTRYDSKRDVAFLKDMIDSVTPVPSSSDSTSENNEEETNSSLSSNSNKQIDFKLSLRYLQEHFHRSNDFFQNSNRKAERTKKEENSHHKNKKSKN